MNWIAELGIILFTFNALYGWQMAFFMALLYAFWSGIKTITAYRMAKKLTDSITIEMGCKYDGNKRSKSRAKN